MSPVANVFQVQVAKYQSKGRMTTQGVGVVVAVAVGVVVIVVADGLEIGRTDCAYDISMQFLLK